MSLGTHITNLQVQLLCAQNHLKFSVVRQTCLVLKFQTYQIKKRKDVFVINDSSSKLQSKKEELFLKQMVMKFYNLEML